MQKKNSSVTVVQDELGNNIRVSKNNVEYGHIRVSQTKVGFSATGWVKKSNVSTLIHGTVEDLQEVGLNEVTELPGNIVVKESTTPFNEEDPDRDLKIAGETGIVCCIHGEPIYRKTFYDASGLQEDELIAHDNGDAIREANAAPTNAKIDELLDKAEKVKSKQVDLEDSIEEVMSEETEEIEDVVTDEIEEEVEDATFEL